MVKCHILKRVMGKTGVRKWLQNGSGASFLSATG